MNAHAAVLDEDFARTDSQVSQIVGNAVASAVGLLSNSLVRARVETDGPRFLYADGLCQAIGYLRGTLNGARLRDYLHPADPAGWNFGEAPGAPIASFANRLRRADGNWEWVFWYCAPGRRLGHRWNGHSGVFDAYLIGRRPEFGAFLERLATIRGSNGVGGQ